jgi:hypothetical protein
LHGRTLDVDAGFSKLLEALVLRLRERQSPSPVLDKKAQDLDSVRAASPITRAQRRSFADNLD